MADIVNQNVDELEEPLVPPSPKDDAAKEVQNQTQGEITPEKENKTPEEVITTGEQQPPEAKSKAEEFFKEWGLSDLFDKKEIGRMVALYLGSRALGYSHGGSLNFAAKNYAERVQQKAATAAKSQAEREKEVRQAIIDGKLSPKAGQMYVKSGNLAYLDSGISKGVGTGEFKTFYKGNQQVRAEKHKLSNGGYEWRTTSDNMPITGEYHQDAWRVPNTKEYNDRRDAFIKGRSDTFKQILDNAKGDEKDVEWTTMMTQITPDRAARDYWTWVASTGRNPDSDVSLALVDRAYAQMIEDAKKQKFTIGSLKPYLEAQHIRESTGSQDLFLLNPEDMKKPPKYVDQDKMNLLFDNVDRIMIKMPEVFGDDSRTINRKKFFDMALTAWADPENAEKVAIYKKTDTPDEGTTGFYKFVMDQMRTQNSRLNQSLKTQQ